MTILHSVPKVRFDFGGIEAAVYDGIPPNPTAGGIDGALAAYRAHAALLDEKEPDLHPTALAAKRTEQKTRSAGPEGSLNYPRSCPTNGA